MNTHGKDSMLLNKARQACLPWVMLKKLQFLGNKLLEWSFTSAEAVADEGQLVFLAAPEG